MKSKKLLIILAIAVVVLLVFFGIGKKAGWFGQEGYLKVAVEQGLERDITELITANGKIQPETEVKITPDVSGEIVELAIKEGDYVEKGQFLLKIKPENYIMIRNRTEASLNNAKAREKQAEAQMDMRKLEFDRIARLFEENAVSKSEFEQAETAHRTAVAEKEAAVYSVASAKAGLEEAEENLEKTSIYAPMTGTISALHVELGERVVGTELMSGTEILRLADLSMMEVEVEVNENDIVRVAYMDTALIEVDAYVDTKFKGVVTEIPVSANVTGLTTDQVTNFNVKIRLLAESYADKISETNPYPLRPGMSATADIQTEVVKGVYTIPIQAVTTRAPKAPDEEETADEDSVVVDEAPVAAPIDAPALEKETVVFVEVDGKAVKKVVKTGIQDNSFIVILEGLNPEDNIIIAPYSAISKELGDDTNVEVVPQDRLYSEG